MNKKKIKGLIASAAIIGVTAAAPSVIAKAADEPVAISGEEAPASGEDTTSSTETTTTTEDQTPSETPSSSDSTSNTETSSSSSTTSSTETPSSSTTGSSDTTTSEDTTVVKTDVDKASEAVGKAESSLLKADYDTAKALVDALAEDAEGVTTKTNLESRLANVLTTINNNAKKQAVDDAENLVKAAEENKTRENYAKANEKVAALDADAAGTSGATKTSLQERLNAVLAKIEKEEKVKAAKDAVDKAKGSLKKSDYDNAKSLVDALDNDLAGETTKSDLQNELKDIFDKITSNTTKEFDDAEKLVKIAEDNKTRENYLAAKGAVELLDDSATGTDSATKTDLVTRLNTVLSDIEKAEGENLKKAQDAVKKALETETRSDYESAKKLVDALSNSDDKTSLETSLSTLLDSIQLNEDIVYQNAARVKVEKAEAEMTRENYDLAKTAVNLINDKDVKKLYEDRLQIVYETVKAYEEKEAKELVDKAEKEETRDNYNAAKEIVDRLDEGTLKTELQNKLNSVLNDLDKAEQVAERIAAKAAVVKAEENGTRDNYNAAKDLVSKLNPCNDKTDLIERLGRILSYLQDKEETAAEVLVKNCEGNSSRDSYDLAKKAVDSLDNTEGKEKLEARLETVFNNINQAEEVAKKVAATQAVVKAENDLSMDSYNSAQDLVKVMQDGDAKKSLLDRLSKVLYKIEDSKKDSMFSSEDRSFMNNIDLSNISGNTANENTTIAIDKTMNIQLPSNFISESELIGVSNLELSCNSIKINTESYLQQLLDQNNYQVLGKKLDFTLNATCTDGSKKLIKNFIKPVQFKITFTDSELAGFNKNLVKMAYYDEEAGKLILLDTYWDGNTCVFSTNHFSSYMLVEVPEITDNNNSSNNNGTQNGTNTGSTSNSGNTVNTTSAQKTATTSNSNSKEDKGVNTETADTNKPLTCAGLLVCSAALVLMVKKRR